MYSTGAEQSRAELEKVFRANMHQHRCILLLPFLYCLFACSNAFSTAPHKSAVLLRSTENTHATLAVSIGRIPGTTMPSEWAASGARLGFALEVGFTDNELRRDSVFKESLTQDVLMGSTLRMILPLNSPSFVDASGTQVIDVHPGAYGCQIQDAESEQYALRWYLDFPNGAKRNDVELPAERIYFLCRCWLPSNTNGGINSSIERAREQKEKVLSDIELTNARLDKIRSTPSAGNILGDLVQNVFNFRHILVLLERKKQLQIEMNKLETAYPLDSGEILRHNSVTYAKEGVVAVRRSRQYCWIGTFTINELA